jgi:predicted phage terminase large subunit-like protein
MDVASEFTPDAAAEEALRRRSVRNNLIAWCELNGYVPARHHRLLLDKLTEVATSNLDRLAIFMPPGSAKSTYSSVLFVPWYLAHNPAHQVISAAHTVELAEKWGRRVRNIVTEYSSILGYDLISQSQAAGRWETNKGAEYYAAGVGGSIAGWRGDLVLIDDPLRSREDAESPTVRDKIWDWYRGDIIPRLKPKGRIVLIQTRWNEDDLAGRIIEEMKVGNDDWTIISLPALAEADDPLGRKEGEPLWPEWESLEELERKRRMVGPRDWIALYQQRPAPEEGSYFKHDWLRPVSVMPDRSILRVYGGSDYAVSEQRGDYTVHVVVGVDPDGRMYLLDLWRAREASDRWVDAFCDLVLKWKPVGWAEEQGQIRSGVGPFLEQRQRERKAYVFRESFPTRGDKQIRCQSIRGRMALDGLYVPSYAPWYPAFRSELLSFPDGAHDDQADALGLVGQLLDIMVRGTAQKIKEAKKPDSGYREWRRSAVAGDWMVYGLYGIALTGVLQWLV